MWRMVILTAPQYWHGSLEAAHHSNRSDNTRKKDTSRTATASLMIHATTGRNCLAFWHVRMGSMIASRHTIDRSEPDMPSACMPNRSKSGCVSWFGVQVDLQHRHHAGPSGKGIYILFSEACFSHWIRSQGMFVAPSTSIRHRPDATPCICTRNSVLMRRVASDSPVCRWRLDGAITTSQSHQQK